MYPRLMLSKNLLKENGIIFINISDEEAANLKKICDEIFGESNFCADIVWNSTKSVTNTALISVSHMIQRGLGKPIHFKLEDGDRINNMKSQILTQEKFIPQMKVVVGKTILKLFKEFMMKVGLFLELTELPGL